MIYIVANWKMNKNYTEAIDYIKKINDFSDFNINKLNILIAPPSIHLESIHSISSFSLVAQNVSDQEKGAFTGEISAQMLSRYVEYVIIGHSERRQLFFESNLIIKKKIDMCFQYELSPIICFGENKESRIQGNYLTYIKLQIEEVLFELDLSKIHTVILAYEPIWAIGTGDTASSQQIEEVHDYVRNLLVAKFGQSVGLNTPILYGGSCNSDNAASILSNLNVNGLLIGGASLDPSHFINIIKIANEFSSSSF
jgi:triosephosphate isomerase